MPVNDMSMTGTTLVCREPPPLKQTMSHPSSSSPESQGKSGGAGKSESTRPHDQFQAPIQGSPSKQQEGQSSGHDDRGQLRRDTDTSDLLPMPANPMPVDRSDLRRGQGEAGRSDTNLRSTPGDSRESLVLELRFCDDVGPSH